MQVEQACIDGGSLAGHCVTNSVGHLEMVQPLGVNLQAVSLLIQDEVVIITGLLTLQRLCPCQMGCKCSSVLLTKSHSRHCPDCCAICS